MMHEGAIKRVEPPWHTTTAVETVVATAFEKGRQVNVAARRATVTRCLLSLLLLL